jgi:flagellar motor protein MotB
MAQPEKAMKPLPRPRRRSGQLHEDANQHLWAVSYADLLMVLMSFFVISFQMVDVPDSSKDDHSPIRDVVLALQNAAQGNAIPAPAATAAGNGPGAGPGMGSGTAAAAGNGTGVGAVSAPVVITEPQVNPLIQQLADSLGEARVAAKVENLEKGIVIQFPDNFYGVGEYAMNRQRETQVGRVLDLIRPHASSLALTFVGHTDTRPVTRWNGRVVDSNLVLSNMRAGKAVEFAVRRGLDPRWITAQGVGEFARSTRSLSIRITARGEEKDKRAR